jgi:hypothetical protein
MYEIVIINGKDYACRFGMNSLRLYCKETNINLTDLDKLGENMTLDDACYLIKAGLTDGARKAGKEFDLTVEDIADMLDEDMDALQKVMEVFTNQFTAKAGGDEGNAPGSKKKAPKKK